MTNLPWKLRSETPPPTDERIWVYVPIENEICMASFVFGGWFLEEGTCIDAWQEVHYLLEQELNLPEDINQ